MDAQGSTKCSRGMVFGGSCGSPGTLLSAPGLLWVTIWDAWAEHLERFGVIFVSQGGVRRENSGKLEFDDTFNDMLRFCGPKGSKMIPKWYQNGPREGKEAEKKRKESREAQKVRSRASWERSGATSFDFGGPWGRVGGTHGWFAHT